jgi:hypothetical protein
LFGLTPANEISFVDCVNEDGEQVLHRPIEITGVIGMWPTAWSHCRVS